MSKVIGNKDVVISVTETARGAIVENSYGLQWDFQYPISRRVALSAMVFHTLESAWDSMLAKHKSFKIKTTITIYKEDE